MNNRLRNDLLAIWRAGVDAVRGDGVTQAALRQDPDWVPDLVIAVGKAAGGMCTGALGALPVNTRAIVVVPAGTPCPGLEDKPCVTILESSHPVPGDDSLAAGQHVLDAVREEPPESRLLLLISGGASALLEVLEDGTCLDELQAKTAKWLACGFTIAEINSRRVGLSKVKGGKLLREFPGAEIRVFAISDVQGDDIATIGSGIGDPALATCGADASIIATNRLARNAAAQWAQKAGYSLRLNEESLYGEVTDVADKIVRVLVNGDDGVYIWGGEPVVHLPAEPGTGGRNQSLGLAVAAGIAGKNIGVIAAGTDGVDGNSNAAGGIVDGSTAADIDDMKRFLDRADAGTWLARHGAQFLSGATGTNVMDLVVAIVGNDGRA